MIPITSQNKKKPVKVVRLKMEGHGANGMPYFGKANLVSGA